MQPLIPEELSVSLPVSSWSPNTAQKCACLRKTVFYNLNKEWIQQNKPWHRYLQDICLQMLLFWFVGHGISSHLEELIYQDVGEETDQCLMSWRTCKPSTETPACKKICTHPGLLSIHPSQRRQVMRNSGPQAAIYFRSKWVFLSFQNSSPCSECVLCAVAIILALFNYWVVNAMGWKPKHTTYRPNKSVIFWLGLNLSVLTAAVSTSLF